MGGLTKVFLSLGIFLLSLLPAGISAIAYMAIGPEDFWQSAAVVMIGGYFCGGLQITLLLLAFAAIVRLTNQRPVIRAFFVAVLHCVCWVSVISFFYPILNQ